MKPKRVFVMLLAGLLVLVGTGTVAAQGGRVDTPCAGYAVDVQQETNGYDMVLTVPLPPAGFKGVHLEVDGSSPRIAPTGEGNNVFRISYSVFHIGSEHHYYANSWTRSGGLIIYSCTDIGTFEIKL